MIILDVFYVALATLAVMGLLHLATFAAIRIMYPPEPKVIYRDVPVSVPQNVGPVAVASHVPVSLPPSFAPPPPAAPAFIQPEQEVQLPAYESRPLPNSTASRLDAGLPDGLQETRPPGT
jgi:hypothetical protein